MKQLTAVNRRFSQGVLPGVSPTEFMSKCADLASQSLKASAVLIAFSIVALGFSPAASAGTTVSFIAAKSTTTPPPGAVDLCRKYQWACINTNAPIQNAASVLQAAKLVNRFVNASVRLVNDSSQYGREEYWTLPSNTGGDCEDFVLLKKQLLIERGVNANDLMIATVLDLNRESHAVLVLRTERGDYVLDSQQSRVKTWRATGYTFLKMQNPNAMGKWNAILAGGLISGAPTGSN